jgi:hypothetical protein
MSTEELDERNSITLYDIDLERSFKDPLANVEPTLPTVQQQGIFLLG